MVYNQVQINKVDNGYLVTANKVVFGEARPEQEVRVFTDFDEVLSYLNPKKVQTA